MFKIKVLKDTGYVYTVSTNHLESCVKFDNNGDMIIYGGSNDFYKIISITNTNLKPNIFKILLFIFKGKMRLSDSIVFINGLEKFVLVILSTLTFTVQSIFKIIKIIIGYSNNPPVSSILKPRFDEFKLMIKTFYDSLVKEVKENDAVMNEIKDDFGPLKDQFDTVDYNVVDSKEVFLNLARSVNVKYEINSK